MTDTTTGRRPRGRPRTTGARTCDRCGRSTGKIRIRWPDGDICGICFHDATRAHGSCHQCGQHRLLPGRDGNRQLCRPCAGITTDLDCHRCGSEGEHHRRGLCTRCTLRDDLNALLLPADGPATTEAARIVDVLATVDRPESIYTWKRNPKVDHLLRGLGDGTIPLTHDGFEEAPASIAREHIRELLVHHGLLPRRDPDLARFERWLQERLDSIDDPTVRRPVEQFARWHHLRRIRRRVGQELRGAVHTSKQEITEVSRFLTWLAERDKTISTCSQGDVDEWLAGGLTTRHAIRTFIVWSGEQNLSSELGIGFRQARSGRLITQDDRLDLLHRCLIGEPDTLAYRVAAVLLLLYAQPLVRVAAMRTEQIQVAPDGLLVLLGKEPAVVPEPFAQLLREHLTARPNLRTANTSGNPWLFPGYRAGRHLHIQFRSWTDCARSASTCSVPATPPCAISSARSPRRSSPPNSATATRSPNGTLNSPPHP
ncbi:hypothetical protein SAMN05892883_2232 [Jatrophihabitans sp. GAS493]|uniref:hypothetical protein n=1 Tax=Jatrophihabitans sp. GAS493 TaxID=1907575 RepID=UPI000BC0C831|nr:hypothetical protein [Jatrophihabitans sp. GAS493]SOD72917.1 hypothetical protein SAMN05892883_2232 [Jatrophihabitans sp. GAS493]